MTIFESPTNQRVNPFGAEFNQDWQEVKRAAATFYGLHEEIMRIIARPWVDPSKVPTRIHANVIASTLYAPNRYLYTLRASMPDTGNKDWIENPDGAIYDEVVNRWEMKNTATTAAGINLGSTLFMHPIENGFVVEVYRSALGWEMAEPYVVDCNPPT